MAANASAIMARRLRCFVGDDADAVLPQPQLVCRVEGIQPDQRALTGLPELMAGAAGIGEKNAAFRDLLGPGGAPTAGAGDLEAVVLGAHDEAASAGARGRVLDLHSLVLEAGEDGVPER